MKHIYLLSSILLFIAIAPMPYGYFTILRIVVTFSAVMYVLAEYEKGINFWLVAFGTIAVLFNPIIPIYLHSKSIWLPIDLIGGIIFIAYYLKINRK